MSGQKLVPMLAIGALIFVLAKLHAVLLPFLLSAAIAYTLNPLVAFFEIRGIRRRQAVVVVYASLMALFACMAFLAFSAAVQSTSNIGAEMPVYIQKTRLFLDRQIVLLEQSPLLSRFELGGWLRARLGAESHTWILDVIQKVPSLFGLHILSFLEMTLLVPLLVFFFMLDGPEFLNRLLDFVPARYVEMTLNVIVEIDYSLGNYLRGILVQALVMGLAAGIGYGLMGLNYTVYIAGWVALSSMVPLLGPISAALTGGLVALFQWGTLTGLLKVVVVYMMIRIVDECVLQPVILRRAVHIHPLMLVFTLVAGAYLGGFWGLLFAVPIACMLKVLLTVGWQWYLTEYGSRSPQAATETVHLPLI